MPFTCSDICKIILALFLPPLGVFAEKVNCLLKLKIIHIFNFYRLFFTFTYRVATSIC